MRTETDVNVLKSGSSSHLFGITSRHDAVSHTLRCYQSQVCTSLNCTCHAATQDERLVQTVSGLTLLLAVSAWLCLIIPCPQGLKLGGRYAHLAGACNQASGAVPSGPRGRSTATNAAPAVPAP